MKKIVNIVITLLLIVTLAACEDDDFGTFLRPNFPEIPVTYTNATTFGGNPFIEVSLTGTGDIQFIMEIPENCGRTIRELRKVAAGTTSINIASLNDEPNFLDAAISGNSNRITFETTLAEFKTKRASVSTDEEDILGFIFELVLDNDQVIIPMEVEVRLTE